MGTLMAGGTECGNSDGRWVPNVGTLMAGGYRMWEL